MRINKMRTVLTMLTVLCGLLLVATTAAAQQTEDVDQAQYNYETNIEAYVQLLRTDVEAQKVEILSALMQFSPEEAAKFWPIFADYGKELEQLARDEEETIRDYAEHFSKMTDDKADSIVARSLKLQMQTVELKKKYYERVKSAMGALTAARFLQIEDQLLLLIDLQVAAMLPVAE